MNSVKSGTFAPRVGHWLPRQEAIEGWLSGLVRRVEAKPSAPLSPVIAEFRELIDRDPVVRLYMTRMISEVPNTKPYRQNHLQSI